MPRHASRQLFNISNDDDPFYTGWSAAKTQVLIGTQIPEVVLIEFSPDGRHLRTSSRKADTGRLDSLLREWQAEIGFTPGLISVRRFFFAEREVGIQDLPDYYQAVLDRPADFDEEERRQTLEDIARWRESGDFVLFWVEDYYFSQDGEMASS